MQGSIPCSTNHTPTMKKQNKDKTHSTNASREERFEKVVEDSVLAPAIILSIITISLILLVAFSQIENDLFGGILIGICSTLSMIFWVANTDRKVHWRKIE